MNENWQDITPGVHIRATMPDGRVVYAHLALQNRKVLWLPELDLSSYRRALTLTSDSVDTNIQRWFKEHPSDSV